MGKMTMVRTESTKSCSRRDKNERLLPNANNKYKNKLNQKKIEYLDEPNLIYKNMFVVLQFSGMIYHFPYTFVWMYIAGTGTGTGIGKLFSPATILICHCYYQVAQVFCRFLRLGITY